MPKMSPAIEGLLRPTVANQSPRASSTRLPRADTGSAGPGNWKYHGVGRSRGVVPLAVFVSLSMHVIFLFGFNRHVAIRRVVVHDDTPQMQMVPPDLKDLDDKPVEELSDDSPQTAGISVPSLIDLPTSVPVNAFVQQIDIHPPAVEDLAGAKVITIPVHISHAGNLDKLGKIFDLSQLDRPPEPMVQPSPVFPPSLKKEYTEATVLVGFIVDAQGGVVAPHVVQSTQGGFNDAAILGVSKWKFRPGMKGGRKVNTRMQVPIKFHVSDEE